MTFEKLYNEPLTAAISIGDSGSALSSTVMKTLLTITIHEDLAVPGMFTLELNNLTDEGAPPWYDDDETFFPGQKIAISLGYMNQTEPITIIQGEITSL